jgi:lysozyme
MNISQSGIDFIKSQEGCKLNAYQDSAGIWTIGWGTISYEDGSAVKKGDIIPQKMADDLLIQEIEQKVSQVNNYLSGLILNQNQFDSLVSFQYNTGALKSSTLLKTILKNPQDHYIRQCFLMWCKANDPKTGKKVTVEGLLIRRGREADLYFKPI